MSAVLLLFALLAAVQATQPVPPSPPPQTRPAPRDQVEQSFRGPGGASFSSIGNPSVNPDGTFIIRNVPPGEYALDASAIG